MTLGAGRDDRPRSTNTICNRPPASGNQTAPQTICIANQRAMLIWKTFPISEAPCFPFWRKAGT